MKKILKKLVLISIVIIIALATKSYAVGSFNISASKTTIDSGESITLSITANNAYGEVIIMATNATVSASSRFLENDTKTVTITSNSTEDIQITVSPSSAGLGDIDENPITESKYLTIKVNKPTTNTGGQTTEQPNQGGQTTGNQNQGGQTTTQTKSSNATLKNLGISPCDFSGFSKNPNKLDWSVEVPNNVEKIEVYAKGHKGQTISGTGTNKTLKTGENKFDVTVTAEDGKTTKTYTINVIRKEAEVKPNEETPNTNEPVITEPNEEEPVQEVFGLSELTIEGIKLKPQFQTDIYEYKIDLKEDIEKLVITAVSTHADTNIEITGNENLVEGENVITIVVKPVSEEESSIEGKTVTYQIVVNKSVEKDQIINYSKQEKQERMKKIIILSIVVGVIAIVIIVKILIKVKNSKQSFDEYSIYDSLENNDNYEEEQKNALNNNEENILNNENYEQEEKNNKKSIKGKRFK